MSKRQLPQNKAHGRSRQKSKAKLDRSKNDDPQPKENSQSPVKKDQNNKKNKSKNDISQSRLGQSIRQFNKGLTSRLTKEYLSFLRGMNNEEVSSRHGFVLSAKQLLKSKKKLIKDFFLDIDQFYHVIDNQNDNQLEEVAFPSYDLKDWEPNFRSVLINWINNGLANEKAVVGIALSQTYFESNSKKFIFRKGINIMKPFDVSSTILENVMSLALKIKSKEDLNYQSKIKDIIQSLYKLNTVGLSQKYLKKYQNYMSDLEKETKNSQGNQMLLEETIYKTNKTDFRQASSKSLFMIRRQNHLKMLTIRFHCVMIRSFYLKASYRARDLALQPYYSFKNEYLKIQKLKNKDINEQSQNSKDKKIVKDLDEEQRLIAEMGQLKGRIGDYQSDIMSLSHINKSIEELQKLIKQLQKQNKPLPDKYYNQVLKTQSIIQQILMNLQAVIVTEVRYIEAQDLIPRQYDQSIEFLFNYDELVLFVQIVDSLMLEMTKDKKPKDEILTFIKNNVPQIKLLLSYRNQTSLIINKIIDDCHQYFQDSFIKREKQYKHKQTQWKELWQQRWHKYIKNILNHLALYNYVMISYQFSKRQHFYLNFYCINEGLSKPIRYNSLSSKYSQYHNKNTKYTQSKIQSLDQIESKRIKRLKFFWKTFQKPQILSKIYEQGTLCLKEVKYIQNNRKLTFQVLFNEYADMRQIQEFKIRYFVHFGQFFLEIISDLSSAENSSLVSVFNVVRFLIINFICFFYIQSVKRIEKQIREKHGQFYYNLLKKQMDENKRIFQCNQKMIDALRLSSDKLKRYINEAQTQQKLSTNVKKMENIFYEFGSIKSLFEKLNCEQPIKKQVKLKNPKDILKMEYDYDIVRETYMAVVILMIKEYISKPVLQRAIKKIMPITKQQISLVKSNAADSSLLEKCNKFEPIKDKTDNKISLFLENKNHDESECYQVYFQKFIVTFFQMTKLSTMIFSMPYYSYQNQIDYARKRKFQKEDKKKSQKQKGKILLNLDIFYIYQRHRINSDFIKSRLKNFQLLNIFKIYLQNVNDFILFMKQDTNGKLKTVKKQQNINVQGILVNHPKYLHNDTLSIYSKLQLQDFFFEFNKQNENRSQFKLERDLHKQLYQFFDMYNKIGKRVDEVCAVIKKQYERPTEKKQTPDSTNEVQQQIKKEKFGSINKVLQDIREQYGSDMEQETDENLNKKNELRHEFSQTKDATRKI